MSTDFNYFYGSQAEQFSFYRIPKILFTDEMFGDISVESKVLYGFMLDRMCLSVKNCWFDDENKVYIIYTVEDIIKDFGCARQKVAKLLDELENGIGLIERKRQGLGKPNIIYVKNFIYKPQEKKYENQNPESMNIENQEVPKSNLQKYENHTSRDMNIKIQEVPKSYSNNTNINNTEYNNTDNSDTEFSKTEKSLCEHPSHLSYRSVSEKEKMPIDMMDEYNKYKEIITVYSLLFEFPSAQHIASANLKHLTTLLQAVSKGRFNRDSADKIRETARRSISSYLPAKSLELKHTIKLIREFDAEIQEIDIEIKKIMDAIDSPILSVPGISYALGSMIVAEVGDFSRFDSPDKILAFAGCSPTTYQSGQLYSSHAKMEKRGSRYLRYALLNSAKYVSKWEPTFAAFLEKKRSEGKHYNVAISHVAKKLVRLLYHLEVSGERYHLVA